MSSKPFASLAVSFALIAGAGACAGETSDDPAAAEPATPEPGATDGTAEPTGVQAEELTALKAAMIARISAGAMPKGNPAWKKSADGKKVLKWLKTGADLKK